jgi:hypothetical protein
MLLAGDTWPPYCNGILPCLALVNMLDGKMPHLFVFSLALRSASLSCSSWKRVFFLLPPSASAA